MKGMRRKDGLICMPGVANSLGMSSILTRIACFSVACVDHFDPWDHSFPGGNALNQAIRFRALGFETLFAGAVGDDAHGCRIKACLELHGAGMQAFHVVEGGRTASNRLWVDALGERHQVPGAWDGGVYESFRLSEADWLQVASCPLWSTHANVPDFQEAIRRKPAETRLFVDFLHLPEPSVLEKSLHAICIAYVGGVPEHEALLLDFSKRRPELLLVLTLGASGSVAIRDGKLWRQAALPLQTVVDTTGCGDAFQASFTASWLHTGDVPRSLLAGARAGAACASRLGAIDG
jgi:fructoselysine 6-kinase